MAGKKKILTPEDNKALKKSQKEFFSKTNINLKHLNANGKPVGQLEEFAEELFQRAGATNETYIDILSVASSLEASGMNGIVRGRRFVDISVFAGAEYFDRENLKRFFMEQIEENLDRKIIGGRFEPVANLVNDFDIIVDTANPEILCEALALAFEDICCRQPDRKGLEETPDPKTWGRPAAKYAQIVAGMIDSTAKPAKACDRLLRTDSGETSIPPEENRIGISAATGASRPRIRVGDICEFGEYPQNTEKDWEPIQWVVTEVKGGVSTLLSLRGLAYETVSIYQKKSYGNKPKKADRWLASFLRKAFNDRERSLIQGEPRRFSFYDFRELDEAFRKCFPTKIALAQYPGNIAPPDETKTWLLQSDEHVKTDDGREIYHYVDGDGVSHSGVKKLNPQEESASVTMGYLHFSEAVFEERSEGNLALIGQIRPTISIGTNQYNELVQKVEPFAPDTSGTTRPQILPIGMQMAEIALSWSELGEISREISAQETSESAIEVAKKHGLVGADGALKLLYKEVVLKDGRKSKIRIVGIAHDELEDGRKAGITFGFMSPIAFRAMNNKETNKGGWERSDLRDLLEGYCFAKVIPDEIAKNIQAVKKPTNNKGKSKKTSCVTETLDRVWLFSRIELAGEWNAKDVWIESPDAPLYDLIADAEGTQYQLFKQLGVDDPYGLVDLGRMAPITVTESTGSKKYWLRSPDPDNNNCFGVVLEKGDIANGYSSTGRYGVLPGFCF